MLIDTHAHLTDSRYDGAESIISSMRADGLEKIITVGYDVESSAECVKIAEEHKDVYCAVGVHPSDAQKLSSDPCERLLKLSRSPKCAAIGEIGLDFFSPVTDLEKQLYWLDRQLEMAGESGLPVCFHVRDAYEDMLRAVKRNISNLKNGAVMHCFSGSLETALTYLDMGFYISFSGSVTFKNAKKFYDIIPALPLDRILVETDCPYLTPHPHRGELNYPRFVRFQAEKIAEIRDMDYAEVERITTENAYRAFPKLLRD